jgi:hypothetical protein
MGKLILFMFLLVSCKEYSSYERTADGKIYIKASEAGIKSADVIYWKVGPYRKQNVSKGVQFVIDFPYLKDSDLEELIKYKNIDSWLIRVHRSTVVGSRIIGQLFVPLIKPGGGKDSSIRITQMEQGFINIYYAAAALSKRFESLECPAFDHRKIVTGVELDQRNISLQSLMVTPVEYAKVEGRVEEFVYGQSVVNGGMDIAGRYTVDITLYNSREHMKYSSYLELPQAIEIKGERNTILSGCSNSKIPNNDGNSNSENVQKFKFGN